MSAQREHYESTTGLERAVANIRERWWMILCTVIVVGGLVFGISLLLEPRYKTTAQIAYSERDAQVASQALSAAGTVGLAHNISNDALALTTTAFAARAGQALGGADADELRAAVQVTADPVGDVIAVTATNADPLEAAEIADAFAATFVSERQKSIQASLTEAQTLLEARLDALTPAEAASDRGHALRQQIEDLSVFLGMQISDYEVLQNAVVPTSAYFPRPLLNLLLGLCAGLVLGVVLALLVGRFDRRIKDRTTFERVTQLPVLGSMPLVPGRPNKSGGRQAVGFPDGSEALLESMRMLRSNLKVLGFGETKRSVLITSAVAGEGKSTLAVNLALTMALSGDRVILVDADLRNPAIDRYLGIPNTEGLGDVLLDRAASWSTRIQAVDVAPFLGARTAIARRSPDGEAPISKFLCLTSGSLPGDPTEVLESGALADLLAELQGFSDYVILDGPPMLTASDSLIVAQCVDAVVLAGTPGRETTAEATQVRQLLARAEITALGLVLSAGRPQ